MIEIINSTFVTSAANVLGAPENEYLNEVVFMARSNVGKSSLLNALSNRKSLAKVSSTPGKTRLINFFDVTMIDRDINERMEAKFVDLPGFGYAKVSKSIKSDWEKNLTDFIAERKQIKIFLHLIDCRHPGLEIDQSVADYLDQVCREDQVIVRVFTKIDKLNQKEQGKLLRDYPGAILVSSSKKRGLHKLISIIYNTLHDDVEGIEVQDD
ncbi:MAG: ribosome biogenesis GTP-binding protein YihA/YsxC [Helicobacteraceae bacterium]|jgi:GTP-binding protein|nr:ribosome biogenesis GTP-binding protein YihA/YsxC [Helicobacteraceae bacterium]